MLMERKKTYFCKIFWEIPNKVFGTIFVETYLNKKSKE